MPFLNKHSAEVEKEAFMPKAAICRFPAHASGAVQTATGLGSVSPLGMQQLVKAKSNRDVLIGEQG
jgi:hypothetical protein